MAKSPKRVYRSPTYLPEKKFLDFFSKKIYKYIKADTLTLIALLGSVLIAYSYIFLAVKNINFLHIATFGIFLHWLGDSLDGRVARLRGEARPKYGHYMDHLFDSVAVTIIFAGIQLSPLTTTLLPLYALVVALLVDVHNHLKATITTEFNLSIANFGGTEARIVFLVFNNLILFSNNELIFTKYSSTDLFALFSLVVLTILFVLGTGTSLWGKNKIKD